MLFDPFIIAFFNVLFACLFPLFSLMCLATYGISLVETLIKMKLTLIKSHSTEIMH